MRRRPSEGSSLAAGWAVFRPASAGGWPGTQSGIWRAGRAVSATRSGPLLLKECACGAGAPSWWGCSAGAAWAIASGGAAGAGGAGGRCNGVKAGVRGGCALADGLHAGCSLKVKEGMCDRARHAVSESGLRSASWDRHQLGTVRTGKTTYSSPHMACMCGLHVPACSTCSRPTSSGAWVASTGGKGVFQGGHEGNYRKLSKLSGIDNLDHFA